MNLETKYPGYKPIPGFENYVINKQGHMINTSTGRTIKFTRKHSGYHHGIAIDKNGKHHTLVRSRTLCRVFKPIPNADEMEVDHINCNKGDDRLENLEWVTGKVNCQRAAANHLKQQTRPILVRDIDTKVVTRYESIAEAARALDLTKDQILYRLHIADQRVFPDKFGRHQFSLEQGFKGWRDALTCKYEADEFGRNKKVLMRDFTEGWEIEFDSLAILCRTFGLNQSTISILLKRFSQPLIPGPRQIRFSSDRDGWKPLTLQDPGMALIKQMGERMVLVTNVQTGKETLYLNQLDCATSRNLLPTTLNNRLKHCAPNTVFSDGCMYKYVDPSEGSTTRALPVASPKLAKYLAPHAGGDIV